MKTKLISFDLSKLDSYQILRVVNKYNKPIMTGEAIVIINQTMAVMFDLDGETVPVEINSKGEFLIPEDQLKAFGFIKNDFMLKLEVEDANTECEKKCEKQCENQKSGSDKDIDVKVIKISGENMTDEEFADHVFNTINKIIKENE